ncbi:MAG: cyclase family protein [Nitrosopumilaceae archaeon]|nr:cyclase family protein [Nitrosopumilaceae archaeon]
MKPIDLTLTISEKLPTFPGSPTPRFISWEKIATDGYNLELLFLSSHTGTHMDAPYHFLEKGRTIDQISVNRLIRKAILITTKKAANQPISKKDITAFESKNQKIPNDATVVFNTGWSKNIGKKHYFEKNPGLSVDAAKYLASKKINLVGIDSPSIDLGTNSKFSVHHVLAKNNILIVENLTNLEKIKSNSFTLAVFPLKLKNATGSPVRAIAI